MRTKIVIAIIVLLITSSLVSNVLPIEPRSVSEMNAMVIEQSEESRSPVVMVTKPNEEHIMLGRVTYYSWRELNWFEETLSFRSAETVTISYYAGDGERSAYLIGTAEMVENHGCEDHKDRLTITPGCWVLVRNVDLVYSLIP